MFPKRSILVTLLYLVSTGVFLLLERSHNSFAHLELFIGTYVLIIASYIYLEIRHTEILKDKIKTDRKFQEILFDLSLDGIYIENEKGEILDCNRIGHEMFGYTKEEMLTKSIRDLVPKELAKSLPEIIPDEMATGDKYVERVNKKKDGTFFPTEINTQYVRIGEEKRLVAYVRDITERKKMEEELKGLSIHDDLTGIFNRRHMMDLLRQMLERLKRYKGDIFSIALIDLDNFKNINDKYGHIFGDSVLKTFADTIVSGVRTVDIVGRYGGEEFLVLFPYTSQEDSKVVMERLQNSVNSLTFFKPVKLSFSAGIIEVFQDDIREYGIDHIIAQVDGLMYQAKIQGKNKVLCL